MSAGTLLEPPYFRASADCSDPPSAAEPRDPRLAFDPALALRLRAREPERDRERPRCCGFRTRTRRFEADVFFPGILRTYYPLVDRLLGGVLGRFSALFRWGPTIIGDG